MSVCYQNAMSLPEEIYLEILGIFLQGQRGVVQSLEEALQTLRSGQALDVPALERLFHQRKGEAGMMGLIPFHQVYAALHRRLHSQTLCAEDLEAALAWLSPALAGLDDLTQPVASADDLLARLS